MASLPKAQRSYKSATSWCRSKHPSDAGIALRNLLSSQFGLQAVESSKIFCRDLFASGLGATNVVR